MPLGKTERCDRQDILVPPYFAKTRVLGVGVMRRLLQAREVEAVYLVKRDVQPRSSVHSNLSRGVNSLSD
jgi:hypothetical protein